MTSSTLLIGVDAGDFRTIDPLLEEGVLPNIQRLIEGGFRGTLASSIPPWTPTAWTSLTTGKNPGKHGIFDFKTPGTDELVNAADVRTHTLWDYCSLFDESSIVVNVPVSHPATNVDGILVPGYLSPEVGDAVGHPRGIIDEIQENIGEYRIYTSGEAETDDELCAEYLELMQMRADAMTYLCDVYDWSFAMVQFQRTDTVFHELPEEQYIRQVYRKLDECVGELMADVGPDNVLLASDHGMGETGDWDFRINTWLLEHGYLKTAKDGYESGWKQKLEKGGSTGNPGSTKGVLELTARGFARLGLTPRQVEGVLQRLGVDGAVKSLLPETLLQSVVREAGDGIDVGKSSAYCPSGPGLGLICDEEIKVELMGKLSRLRDPDGDKVFESVQTAEDVYDGSQTDIAPDVISYPRDMQYFVSASITAEPFPVSRYQYNHMPSGVFLGAGDSVLPINRGLSASIHDVAPTILAILGVPLDREFDGEVLEPVLDGVPVPERLQYITPERMDSASTDDDVKERLRELGYME